MQQQTYSNIKLTRPQILLSSAPSENDGDSMRYFSNIFVNKATDLPREENFIWIPTLNINLLVVLFTAHNLENISLSGRHHQSRREEKIKCLCQWGLGLRVNFTRTISRDNWEPSRQSFMIFKVVKTKGKILFEIMHKTRWSYLNVQQSFCVEHQYLLHRNICGLELENYFHSSWWLVTGEDREPFNTQYITTWSWLTEKTDSVFLTPVRTRSTNYNFSLRISCSGY